jgi:hypothetical protein
MIQVARTGRNVRAAVEANLAGTPDIDQKAGGSRAIRLLVQVRCRAFNRTCAMRSSTRCLAGTGDTSRHVGSIHNTGIERLGSEAGGASMKAAAEVCEGTGYSRKDWLQSGGGLGSLRVPK